MARVTAVRAVDLAMPDVEAARRFFVNVWNLAPVLEESGMSYLRATGPAFHVLSLREAPTPAMIRIWLDTDSPNSIDVLFGRIEQSGRPVDGPPRRLSTPGGGYGFGFQDPEGRNYGLACEMQDHLAARCEPDRPTKLSHVNLNSGNNDASFRFMRDVLGFTLSDQTGQFRFARCNTDHHSLVLGFNEEASLNHIAFEMPDLDGVMRGIGRMRDHGYPVEWGPGRHGPGNNVFAYFCGPEDIPLEYTSDMQQIDAGYRVRPVEEWGWPPGRVDHWGITPGPTARVKGAQRLFRFTSDGYRLEG